MKQTYKLIFIALLLLGLCVSGVQAVVYNPNFLPIMTSNTTPDGNYTIASSWYTSNYPYKLFDDVTVTPSRWVTQFTSVDSNRSWVKIHTALGPKVLRKYDVVLWPSEWDRAPVTWNLYGSNGNSSQTLLDSQTGFVWGSANSTSIEISNTLAFSDYNLSITQNGGATLLQILEIRAYDEYLPAPAVSFTATPTTGVNPLTVSFNDTTTSGSPITSYNASLGDGTWWNGTAFPSINITHLYSTAGNYTVDWYVTNAEGTGSASTTITVWGAVHSAFSMFNAAGTAPHTTHLYDQSTNLTPGPVTYLTDFGDGNTSTEANTYYTWNITGEYNVTHTVSNGVSSSTSFTNVTVGNQTAPAPAVIAPVASFYGSPTTGNVPLTVSFTDVSSNTPTSWNWSFGDGIYSELQNPSHAYNRSGFKNVALTATNSAGSNITVRLKFVRVS